VVGQRGPLHGPPLTLKALPPYVPRAFLAAEDRRFYTHPGVDVFGALRAAAADLKSRGRSLQGGSTITQQIARTLFLTSDQTLKRKVQEAALAFRIEHLLTKDEILELYLNRIYFGDGAYGLEAASQVYFAKPAPALTLSEAALLAALPKAPTQLSPTNDLSAALARSRLVLAAMEQAGWITPAERAFALAHPPAVAGEPRSEGDFGYVLDLAGREAQAVNRTRTPDLVVRLTIDAELQTAAADAVRAAVVSGKARGVTQGALVALAPDGGVLALVGGVDHRASPFDRATQALRQPGSAFKPLVYAAALEKGLLPSDVRPDAPIRIGSWRPENADGVYVGPVTLSDAFARSINTVAVRVAEEAGPEAVGALARRFGLVNIPAKPSAAIALGAYETTLLDLSSAYAVFQNGGRRCEPYLISSISNARGDVLFARNPVPPPRIYDPVKAGEMVEMMQGVVTHGTGVKAALDRPAAGKTGTSQTYKDAWFIGFTPDLLAGVWLGDDRDRPMRGVMGGGLPAEAWRRFMMAAEKGAPPRAFDLVAPPPDPEKEEARRDFYGALADAFDQTLAETAPPEGQETQTPPQP